MTEREEAAKKRAELIKKKKRRRRRFIFVFFLIIMLAFGSVASFTFLFPIKSVSASGSKLYTESAIVKSSKLMGKNLFTVSEEDLLVTLNHDLPYIDSVTLKRSFPDKIILKVKDAKPYASYHIDNKYYKVSRKGNVLEYDYTLPENTFEIICPDVICKVGQAAEFKSKETKELINSLISSLEKNEIKINKIDVSNTSEIKFFVDGRFDVLLGSKTNYENKIAQLGAMIKNIESDKKGTINLSIWNESGRQTSFIPS